MKKKYSLGLVLSCLALLATVILSAQSGPPLAGTGPGGCFPPPCIPVDGGLSLLIAGAVALGSKKAYDHHKGA